MSLRYASKVLCEAGKRMKDQIFKREAVSGGGAFKCSKKNQAVSFTRFSSEPAAINKHKQAEESLRTVMYLSCWAPN